MQYLQFARSQGDMLIVSLTADPQVNKGVARPLIPEDLRAANLAALECVEGGERLEITLCDSGRGAAAASALEGIGDGRPEVLDGVVRVPLRERSGATPAGSRTSTACVNGRDSGRPMVSAAAVRRSSDRPTMAMRSRRRGLRTWSTSRGTTGTCRICVPATPASSAVFTSCATRAPRPVRGADSHCDILTTSQRVLLLG